MQAAVFWGEQFWMQSAIWGEVILRIQSLSRGFRSFRALVLEGDSLLPHRYCPYAASTSLEVWAADYERIARRLQNGRVAVEVKLACVLTCSRSPSQFVVLLRFRPRFIIALPVRITNRFTSNYRWLIGTKQTRHDFNSQSNLPLSPCSSHHSISQLSAVI